MRNDPGTPLQKWQADPQRIRFQADHGSNATTALNHDLGALADTDLLQESAMLQSLQLRQQVDQRPPGPANPAPQILLSLFR